MNSDLARAMREATTTTRAYKLTEATRLIQVALSGKPSVPRTPSNVGSRGADRVEEPVPQLEHAPAGGMSGGPARLRRGFGWPLKRSLGEVIKALRGAKLRGLAPDGLPGVKPRGTISVPEGAQFLTASFTAPAGSRDYKLYLPRNRSAGSVPLIVMLHGCTQEPDDFAIGTGMNALAEEFGFLVAYPSQPATANPSSCWNWFAPKDQLRGAGEPSIIAGLTQEIVARHDVDSRRVYVAGLSAGGAMATVMAATYPDVYAAVGVHSGLPYRAAVDVVSAFAAMRGDSFPGQPTNAGDPGLAGGVRVIVFHGDADPTVHPSNAARIVEAYDHLDDDFKERASGVVGGRSFTRTTIRGHDGSSRLEHWLVQGAGHAWSGGNPEGSYADAAGPSASREMVRFFIEER
jgi:poly(hydroxyalkanoate) depolymerase family esterase